MSRPSLLRAVGRAAPFRLINRAGAAALPMLLAAWYGRSQLTDLYGLLVALFTLAGALLFACFQDSALVPLVMDLDRRDRARAVRFARALLGHTLLLASLLATLIGAAVWLWFRHRVPPAFSGLLAPLVLGWGLYLPALALRSLGSGLLAARFGFLTDAVGGALGMTVTVTLAVIFHHRGLPAIPFALAAGEATAAGILLTALARRGLLSWPCWDRPPELGRLIRLVSSEIGGAALVRVNPLVDQLVAQGLGVLGGGTILRLSGDLATTGTSLLGPLFLSVLLSHLSFVGGVGAGAGGDQRAFRRTVRRSLLVVVAALSALALGLFVARAPLVALVYGRGAMDRVGLQGITEVLPFHLIGVPALGALMVLARAHVSLGNSRILIRMGACDAALNLGLNLILAGPLGLRGIALATALVHTGIALSFWFHLRRARPAFILREQRA